MEGKKRGGLWKKEQESLCAIIIAFSKKLPAASFIIKLCAAHCDKAGPVNEPIV